MDVFTVVVYNYVIYKDVFQEREIMAQRTGLRTLHRLLRHVCRLFATFSIPLYAVVPADKHVYLDAVRQACDDFVLNVNPAEIFNDEKP